MCTGLETNDMPLRIFFSVQLMQRLFPLSKGNYNIKRLLFFFKKLSTGLQDTDYLGKGRHFEAFRSATTIVKIVIQIKFPV